MRLRSVFPMVASAVNLAKRYRTYRRERTFLDDYAARHQLMRTIGEPLDPQEMKAMLNMLGPTEIHAFCFSGHTPLLPAPEDLRHEKDFVGDTAWEALSGLEHYTVEDAAQRLSFSIRDQARKEPAYFFNRVREYRYSEHLQTLELVVAFDHGRFQARYDAFISPRRS